MTIAAKHFDPLVGLDTHIILIPSPAGPIPTPLPHPYVGMVFDPMDYAPFIGASTYINGLPRGQAGSSGQALPPHIPMGGPFAKPPSNESEIFMGSSVVLVEDEPQSFLGMPVLSCQDIGMPAPPRAKKKSVAKSLMLPTTVVLCIPMGMLVLIGGPPTISMMAIGMRLGLGALKKLRKSKLMKKLSDKIHAAAEKAMKKLGLGDAARNMVHKAICTVTGHPVDVATGKLFTDNVDFALPGPIPLRWERTWFSTSTYAGPLGHGWHHSYDQMLYFEDGVIIYQTGDGRHVGLPYLKPGGEHFDRREKLTFFRDGTGYAIRDRQGLIHRFLTVSGRPASSAPLVALEDALGSTVRFYYDARGHLTQIVDCAGRLIHLETDRDGRIIAVSSPSPDTPEQRIYQVRYGYDGFGNLATVWDALGQPSSYVYNRHLLSKETNRNGLSFYFAYDGPDHTARCIHTWGDGGIYDHKLTYEEPGGITRVEDSLGHVTVYFHHGGVVVKTRDALGSETETEYNDFTELVRIKDALGQEATRAYDDRGSVTKLVGPDGAKLTLENDERGLPVRATDSLGGQWEWVRDAHGHVVEAKNPLGNATTYVYQGSLLIGVVAPDGGKLTADYDTAGNITRITGPDGTVTAFAYDRLGRLVSTTNAKGAVERRVLDALGRAVRIEHSDGGNQQMSYDAEGNLLHVADRQREASFTYQGMNRMSSRTMGEATVRFEYDAEERLVALVNEHGYAYRFLLGPTGEVVEETRFGGVLRRFSYDAAGRTIRIDRPADRFSVYTYDARGRPTGVQHSDGTKALYSYRLDGALESASNDKAVVRFERDAMGHVTKEARDDFWVESTYDAMGRRTAVKSSLGASLKVRRNAVGDVARIQEEKTGFAAEFQRDELGLELARSLPGGVRARWQRDVRGRPLQHTVESETGLLRAIGYSWEANDRLRMVIDSLQGPTELGHDQRDNLAWTRRANAEVEWRMPDAVGNLFRSSDRSDRQYGPAGELLSARTTRGITRYEYDVDGNLQRKLEPDGSVWTYEWGMSGMLASVTRPDGTVVSFAYDALGRRISKTYLGQTTHWVWDGNNPLHEWVEGALATADLGPGRQAPAAAAINRRDAELLQHLSQGPPSRRGTQNAPITWVFEPDRYAPAARLWGNEALSIVTDHLGTPALMTDSSGAIVWRAELDALGELRQVEGDRLLCPFRWPGQYEDAETGLHYNRHRYYDPAAGAYISQDPLGLFGGDQLYSYVNDPTRWIDPLGLVAAPASLPNDPGVYILTNGNDCYVGSSGIGTQGMADRISDVEHAKAQDLLSRPGTKVEYVPVDLGTATSASDRNNILRYYEQRELDRQQAAGRNTLNDPNRRIQAEKKRPHAEGLIQEHGAKPGRKRTCK